MRFNIHLVKQFIIERPKTLLEKSDFPMALQIHREWYKIGINFVEEKFEKSRQLFFIIQHQ